MVTIDVAGGPYRLSGLSAGRQRALLERFGPLCTDSGRAPAVEVDVAKLDRDDRAPADTRGWEYTLEMTCESDRVEFCGWGLAAHIDVPVRRGTLATSVGASSRFAGVVENFLRVAVAYRLLELGGALLHSAGIVDGDGARVFFGKSGAGKTTLAAGSAAAGKLVLSDELSALWRRPDTGEVRVERLPFAGDFGGAPAPRASYAALGLYRISHAEHTELVELGPAEALGSLVAACPFVNGDPHRNEQLIDTLVELSSAVAVQGLDVSLRQSVWDAIGWPGGGPGVAQGA